MDEDAQIEAVLALVTNVMSADQSPLQKKICELHQRLRSMNVQKLPSVEKDEG
jgi:hypothetical protein